MLDSSKKLPKSCSLSESKWSHFCIFSKAGDPTDDICCFPYNSIMWCNLVTYFSFLHYSLQPFTLFLRRQAILLPFCTITFLAPDRVTFRKSKLFENVGETIFMTIPLPMIVLEEESKIQIHNVKMLSKIFAIWRS